MAIPSESKVCKADVAGCKAYKGNAAGNEQIVLNVPFLMGDLEKFKPAPDTVAHLETLPEGQVGNMTKLSLKPEQVTLSAGEYVVSFWLKEASDTAADVSVALSIGATEKVVDIIENAELIDEQTAARPWKLYSYNFAVGTEEAFGSVTFTISSSGNKYIDNLQVRMVEDVHYVIKNSWAIPASCNRDLFDAPLNQAQVGCKEYKDRAQNKHYLKSFSGLCVNDKVGCEALIDTKNSNYPYGDSIKEKVAEDVLCSVFPDDGKNYTGVKSINSQNKKCEYVYLDSGAEVEVAVNMSEICNELMGGIYGRGQRYEWNSDNDSCEVTVDRENADEVIYLVNDEKMSCKSSAKGCTALGKPAYTIANNAQVVDTWETNFYRIDPDLFGSVKSPVCPTYALSCEEYKDENDATFFFKDPLAKLCEWRKGNIGSETQGEAWFVKGAEGDILCGGYQPDQYEFEYKDNMLSDYNLDGNGHLLPFSDPRYRGWTGACPGEQDKCTGFIEPTDDPQNDGLGRAYYYLNNEQIDRTCTSVSLKSGCMLFNNTSNPQLTVKVAH